MRRGVGEGAARREEGKRDKGGVGEGDAKKEEGERGQGKERHLAGSRGGLPRFGGGQCSPPRGTAAKDGGFSCINVTEEWRP